jgi:hypothetical protein
MEWNSLDDEMPKFGARCLVASKIEETSSMDYFVGYYVEDDGWEIILNFKGKFAPSLVIHRPILSTDVWSYFDTYYD